MHGVPRLSCALPLFEAEHARGGAARGRLHLKAQSVLKNLGAKPAERRTPQPLTLRAPTIGVRVSELTFEEPGVMLIDDAEA
eukprot:6188689-Pleurochrysis_carterae.AAC.2